MKIYQAIPAALMACLVSVSGANAQQQRPQPPQPDFSALASEVGVPTEALTNCMDAPSEAGQRPSRPDAAKIASCLGGAGYAVSEADLDSALKAAAPPARN
ncbi:hypothetical protein [Pseudooceanicola algae]|uniref:Uncharacterized protein n=1 Tax=Pseudooceanicola algae TaxID=1537215 RepID=A0A418SHI4_9RHOB|nr:hypothetical protein [Pseudooceanicola algae]QPM90454.1 hypothetical protein PSAL_016930 [Pseudooceanicola algae]